MTTVVGVRFKDSGKIYYVDSGGLRLERGDTVIVETTRGPDMAQVAYTQQDIGASDVPGELRNVIRRAETSDFERMRLLQSRHDEVMNRCARMIAEHGLPMGLVKTEYSFDGSRLTFYFTSEQRVDFRMLVRDLARTFRSRIELRQIGPRDEARLLGGIGPCGRPLCCATFLPDYARVSIKMAKDQDLPLNPSKISGVCGRLLCCLSYEHQQYVDMRSELPSKGDWVQTPDGPGDVVAVNVLKSSVTVRLASSSMQEDYTIAQIQHATTDVQTVARHRAQEGITPDADREPGSLWGDSSDYTEVGDSDLLRLLDEDTGELDGYAPDKPPPRKPSARNAHSAPHHSEASDDARTKSSSKRRRRRPKKDKDQSSQSSPAAAGQQAPGQAAPRHDKTEASAAAAGSSGSPEAGKRKRSRRPRRKRPDKPRDESS
jgi:cell fate regulator YaaT (PSP1 superfamily)